MAIARPHDGRVRYATATATAVVANAAAGPSPVSGPVVHSRTPLTAASPAASSARPRSIVCTPIAYTASVTTMPASTGSSRGAFRCESPTRSATCTSGRKSGPCGEKMSRNGAKPSRIAIAARPYPPSS